MWLQHASGVRRQQEQVGDIERQVSLRFTCLLSLWQPYRVYTFQAGFNATI